MVSSVRWFIVGALAVIASGDVRAQLAAFPGADGAGRTVTGGRGGVVYHVTSLAGRYNDPNRAAPGTLAYGLADANFTVNGAVLPRTIVFDVGGTIDLSQGTSVALDLKDIRNVTVAGQTAPSLITIIGNTVQITGNTVATPTSDIIFQHVAIRKGVGDGADALSIKGTGNTHDIFVDHVSGSWSEDEVISATQTATNVTVQNSIMAEALTSSHAYGALIRPTVNSQISYNANLFADQKSRNPRPGTYDGMTLDFEFQNNVIYNWSDRAGYIAGADTDTQHLNMNYVGNYLIAGPVAVNNSSNPARRDTAFLKEVNASPLDVRVYQSGNKIDSNANAIRDGVDTGWGMFQQLVGGVYGPLPVADRNAARFDYPDSTPDTADDAYARSIATAGAMPWMRSPIDERIVGGLLTYTGTAPITAPTATEWASLTSGSMTTRPAGWDTDGDGMPNSWEAKRGTNPNVADNNGLVAGNGYTNLENYLNSLSAQAVWYADGNGDAADFMNWRGDRPTTAASIATFGDVIAARRTVMLGVPLSVQDLTFESVKGYSLTGTRSLTLDALAGYATLTVASGSHVISAPLVLADDATVTVASGSATLMLERDLMAIGKTLTKAGGGLLGVPQVRGIGLGISAGTVRLAQSGAGVSEVASLSVDEIAGGRLDVGTGSVTVAAGGMITASLIADLVAGRDGGTWNGAGISSSAVAAEVASGAARALGWIDSGDGTLTLGYAALGDTNIDGVVDVLDATNVLVGERFNQGPPAVWNQGDFNYDGVVDVLDMADFVSTGLYNDGPYNSGSAPLSVSAVPEPTPCVCLAVVVVFVIQRCSRISRCRCGRTCAARAGLA